MDAMILTFAATARAAGLRVSTAEVLDCLAQLPLVDVLDEAQFAATLRANFAKSRMERARFEPLYQLFFHDLQRDQGEDAVSLDEPAGALRHALREIDPQAPVMAAIADFLVAEPAAFLGLLQAAQQEGPGEGGPPRGPSANLVGLARRLPMLQALYRAQAFLDRFVEEEGSQLDAQSRVALARRMTQRLKAARRLLMATEPRPDVAEDGIGSAAQGYGALGAKPFANLSPGEIASVREVILALTRRLRDVVSLRQATRSRGVLDLKKTLRASARTQGVPLKLLFRRRPRRKGRVLVLCDISGSVWSSARFMLTTLYSLQDCFDRVRSFVFIDEPVEVTRLFDDHPIDRALDEVFDHPEITFGVPSDYGSTLRLFKARHLDAINKKTTVIVIGDGRSNYGDPEEGIVQEIRGRCRRLLWLSPEEEARWGTADSEMLTYRALANEARTCQNLNQLAAFFQELVL
jgi:uncharacterized protein